jgi:DNA-directed RNA polymerase subunit beta'
VRFRRFARGAAQPTTVGGPRATGRVETTVGRILFNDILPPGMPFYNCDAGQEGSLNKVIDDVYKILGRRATISLLDNIKSIGFKLRHPGRAQLRQDDLRMPSKKKELLGRRRSEVDRVEKNYEQGVITERERYNQISTLGPLPREQGPGRRRPIVEDAEERRPDEGVPYLNPVYLHGGLRAPEATLSQMQQLAGMRGLMAKPSGEIIETPIKANFREGLSVLEYFSSTHGARKGLADTALKTADSGYLTRKLATSPRTWSSTRTTAAPQRHRRSGYVYKGDRGRRQPRREHRRPGGARHDRQRHHGRGRSFARTT